MSWNKVALGEILPFRYGKGLPARDRSESGEYAVISSAGLTGSHSVPLTTGPSVVIGRKGTIGAAYFCPTPVWPIDTTFYVEPTVSTDIRFAYYLLKSLPLNEMNNDSAVPGLNRAHAESLEVLLPPPAEQRAIASTLGALDDKIESNRRVVALSRQLTQSHYHAAAKHRVTASEVLTPVLGGTPKRDIDDYWNGAIKWASAKDIAGAAGGFVLETAETISAEGIANSAAKVMPAGTIVMTARGTVGALARLSDPMAFNQSCYGLRSHAGHEATLLAALEASVTRIKDSGHGTVFNTVNMATFDQIELDIPDDQGLNIVLENLSRKILQSLKENVRLTRIRDSLIPELLSGRIRVPVEGVEA